MIYSYKCKKCNHITQIMSDKKKKVKCAFCKGETERICKIGIEALNF